VSVSNLKRNVFPNPFPAYITVRRNPKFSAVMTEMTVSDRYRASGAQFNVVLCFKIRKLLTMTQHNADGRIPVSVP